jgi:NAD(P)-dependent dehydrogenase (short-subunit alcohol dehydrogenase family)
MLLIAALSDGLFLKLKYMKILTKRCNNYILTALAQFGRLDILVNNAGVQASSENSGNSPMMSGIR